MILQTRGFLNWNLAVAEGGPLLLHGSDESAVDRLDVVRSLISVSVARGASAERAMRHCSEVNEALAAAPPVRREEMRALSRQEMGQLFAALDGERLRALIITSATLGLRRGELIALRWTDVDLDGAIVQIRRTGTRLGKRYVEGPPKSERSRRTISLPAAIVGMLRKQSASVAEEKLRLGAAWEDGDRVFPREGGGPLGETTIRKALERALSRAELDHLRVHDLRHTAATALLTAGGSLRDVQEMLGHTSYAFTADRYTHVLDDQRKATADRIDRALGSAIVGAKIPRKYPEPLGCGRI